MRELRAAWCGALRAMGFYYLKDDGVMAIIVPHGVLFRGGTQERIRAKLLKNGQIDTVIGLPANLFYSTEYGINKPLASSVVSERFSGGIITNG